MMRAYHAGDKADVKQNKKKIKQINERQADMVDDHTFHDRFFFLSVFPHPVCRLAPPSQHAELSSTIIRADLYGGPI